VTQPAAQFYVFEDESSADACASTVDGVLGFPAAGVDVGGGIHAPAEESVTQTYALVTANSDASEWAYPADDNTTAALAANPPVLPVVAPKHGNIAPVAQLVALPAPAPLDDSFQTDVPTP
jgi:hypothetical protein